MRHRTGVVLLGVLTFTSIADAAWATRAIFLNRNGGTYTSGSDNASTNTSAIVDSPATIPAYAFGDSSWNQIAQCVRTLYAPFDVTITESDPGAAQHVEIVVGGTSELVLATSGAGSVAPIGCSVSERGIAFVFSATIGDDPQYTCEAIARTGGHLFTLDAERLCGDVMTWITGCGPAAFLDQTAPCGDTSERDCICGGTQQNSYQKLLSVLGPAPADTTDPIVTIDSPVDGATVSATFLVETTVSDDVAVAQTGLYIDGALDQTSSAPDPSFQAGPLAAGEHTIEVVAFDPSNNEGNAWITVTVEGGDADADAGATCQGAACGADADRAGSVYCAVSLGRPAGDGVFVLALAAVALAPVLRRITSGPMRRRRG